MNNAVVNIGGKEYKLFLSTAAVKEIAGKYGGLEKLGDKLFKTESFEKNIDEIVWLIALLANQQILVDNFYNGTSNPTLTAEMVALLTSPSDLVDFKDAIIECFSNGTNRTITSESDSSKNKTAE